MDVKKVLIGVAIIGGLYWLYTKSKKSTSTDDSTSNANGAQLLAIRNGYSQAQGQGEKRACNCANANVSCGETYGLTQCVECCRKAGSQMVSWGSARTMKTSR